MADLTLTDVPGVGPRTSDSLMTLGIDTVASLAAAPVELLSTLPGFYPSRSRAVKAAANGLLTSKTTAKPSGGSIHGTVEAKKERTTGKKKKKKKKNKNESKQTDTETKKKKKKKKKTGKDKKAKKKKGKK
ncbi:MAG: helix-hairpin-helix domain-containing protein [Holophagae bacterium]